MNGVGNMRNIQTEENNFNTILFVGNCIKGGVRHCDLWKQEKTIKIYSNTNLIVGNYITCRSRTL